MHKAILVLVLLHGAQSLVLTPSKVIPLKLYGEWVDAGKYAERHAGGRWLLECAKGKDISLLFSAIHVMDQAGAHAAAQKLPRLEEHENVAGHVFSLSNKASDEIIVDSALRDDLHNMMRRHFESTGNSKATTLQWIRVFLAGALTISCWYQWAVHGDILATTCLPFAAWLLASHTCHDATHGSLSESPAINYWFQFTAHPLFFNVFVWIPQHLISHHQHTNNAELDVDLHHFAPARLSYQSPSYASPSSSSSSSSSSQPQQQQQEAAFQKFVVKGCLSTLGTCILQPARTLFSKNTPHFETNITPVPTSLSKPALLLSMLPSLAVLFSPLIFHHDLPIAQLAFIEMWPWIGASMIWTAMTQVSHIQHSTQSDPSSLQEIEACWTAQQISSSLDYSVTDPRERIIVSALTGGLNAQALHHALPTVAQAHLPDLYDDFTQICEKHGLRRATSKNLVTASAECLKFVFDNNGGLVTEDEDDAAPLVVRSV